MARQLRIVRLRCLCACLCLVWHACLRPTLAQEPNADSAVTPALTPAELREENALLAQYGLKVVPLSKNAHDDDGGGGGGGGGGDVHRPIKIVFAQGTRVGSADEFMVRNGGRTLHCHVSAAREPRHNRGTASDIAPRSGDGAWDVSGADVVVAHGIYTPESRTQFAGNTLTNDQLLVLMETEDVDPQPKAKLQQPNITAYWDMQRSDINLTFGMWNFWDEGSSNENAVDEYVSRVWSARPAPFETLKKEAFFAATNCAAGRLNYVKELHKYFPVASVGTCFRTATSSAGRRNAWDEMVKVVRNYAFCLAFDHGNTCPGWLSDRLTVFLQAGCLPVYWGGGQIHMMVPHSHAVIDSREFASPRELAAHLHKVVSNRTMYEEYFAWKQDAPDPNNQYVRFTRNNFESFADRLCARVARDYDMKPHSGLIRRTTPRTDDEVQAWVSSVQASDATHAHQRRPLINGKLTRGQSGRQRAHAHLHHHHRG